MKVHHRTAQGMSLLGLIASSETVVTASNPKYAKNSIEAAFIKPYTPFEKYGFQLEAYTYGRPKSMTEEIKTILKAVSTVVKKMLAFVPYAMSM